MEPHARVAWAAAAVAVGAVLVACVLGARGGAASARTKEMRADALLRASKQWTDAARTDDNPLARVLHAAYGAAYMHAARAVASDEALEATAGISVTRMLAAADAQQRSAVRALAASMAASTAAKAAAVAEHERALADGPGGGSVENSSGSKVAAAGSRMPAYRPR